MPPIVRTVATSGEGLAELTQELGKHRAFLDDTEAGRAARAARRESEFWGILHQALLDALEERFAQELAKSVQDVIDGTGNPYAVAEELVKSALGKKDTP